MSGLAEIRDAPASGARRRPVAAVVRAALVLLAAMGALIGFWALIAPASFYSSFPGLGWTWVSDAGPYDEHLVRDVGALYLALVAVTLVSLLRPHAAGAWVAGLAWLVFGVPHLIFHAAHSVSGQVPELIGLGASVVLAAIACLPTGRQRP